MQYRDNCEITFITDLKLESGLKEVQLVRRLFLPITNQYRQRREINELVEKM